MKQPQAWTRRVVTLALLCASLAASAAGGGAGTGAKGTAGSKDFDLYRSGNAADAQPPQAASRERR